MTAPIRMPPIVVSRRDVRMMHRIQRFIMSYCGDDLLHDIELAFPGASYRAFFLAYRRALACFANVRGDA